MQDTWYWSLYSLLYILLSKKKSLDEECRVRSIGVYILYSIFYFLKKKSRDEECRVRSIGVYILYSIFYFLKKKHVMKNAGYVVLKSLFFALYSIF
jgi:hypothetical protein